jgi:hypothetical protein
LVGEKVSVSTVRVEDETVFADTNVTVRFAPGTNLASSGTVKIDFPDSFALPSTFDDQCYNVQVIDAVTECSFTLDEDGVYIDYVTLEAPCKFVSGGCESDIFYQFRVPIQNRGDSWPLDGTTYFYITTSEGNADVAIGEKVNSVALEPYPLEVYEAYPDPREEECDRTFAYCSMYIVFNLVHGVPRKSGGGRILITLPDEITLRGTSCSVVYGNIKSGFTCKGYRQETGSYIIVTQEVFDTMYT